MASKVILTDGSRHATLWRVKSVDPWAEDEPGVWAPDYTEKDRGAAKLVPSVLAGLGARTQAMADLPFTIYAAKGDKALDSSDNYKNVVGFLPYPNQFFALTEGALACYGRAYWHKAARGAQTGSPKELRYWRPDTVRLLTNPDAGLVGFERTVNGKVTEYGLRDVLYFWHTDPDVEVGAPLVWPLEAALTAAEANRAITGWVRDYMRRGAIKAMLLSIDGAMPPKDEIERMETWFNRFMTGLRGLTWKVFNGGAVKPVIVGDGLEALKDMTISSELRYEIHTALGTRHLLEDENFATARVRERQFYTQTIVPDARVIQQALNEQALHGMGYHLEFEPERLEAFQEDEAARATSLADLMGVLAQALPADVALQIAMGILGYDLDSATKALMENGFAAKKEEAEQQAKVEQQRFEQQQAAKQPPAAQGQQVRGLVELDKWEAKSTKAGKVVTWHPVDLPAELVEQVKGGRLTFDAARALVKQAAFEGDAVGALRLAVRALEQRSNAADD